MKIYNHVFKNLLGNYMKKILYSSVLTIACGLSTWVVAEEKEELIEVKATYTVAICNPEMNCSASDVISKDVSISLKCRNKTYCSGDWDFTFEKDDNIFNGVIIANKEISSEGTVQYEINAGIGFYLNTVYLEKGNQLTDTVTFLGQIVNKGEKIYITSLTLSPKGVIPKSATQPK
jgi:hypothetical protein